jgi:hypothetical protein
MILFQREYFTFYSSIRMQPQQSSAGWHRAHIRAACRSWVEEVLLTNPMVNRVMDVPKYHYPALREGFQGALPVIVRV